MFGIKLWYTPGTTGCDRCGAKRPVASVGWFTMTYWCAKCLKEAGRDR